MAISGPFIYAIFIRHKAWHLSLSLAQLLWDMPAAAVLSYLPPSPIWLVLQSLYAQLMLLLLWESSNILFSAFVAQEPLRKGQLLSDESRDPNGTLLNGLQSKREVPKAFALWELVYISHCSERRRKLIFEDIDRTGGSAWEQVRSACLGLVLSISDRITQFQSPPNPSSRQQLVNVETLPRLSAPLRQDPILSKPLPLISNRAKIESNFGAIAKSYGQQHSPFLFPRTKQIINITRNKLLTPETEDQLLRITPASLRPSFDGYLMWILNSSFGWPFRQRFDRIIRSIVFESPDGQFGQIVDAIDVLSALTVASLEEDKFGKVAKDVALLIQTYGATISVIEAFVASVPVHWTDTEFKSREVVEVDTVLAFLKSGLKEMLCSFSEYAKDLGISEQEIHQAKKIS
ncbi:hypothetical protein MMC31_005878, partial [Peltigera leucophlebia]|nr:hypothetical protein [Peltigera leucophlebia]